MSPWSLHARVGRGREKGVSTENKSVERVRRSLAAKRALLVARAALGDRRTTLSLHPHHPLFIMLGVEGYGSDSDAGSDNESVQQTPSTSSGSSLVNKLPAPAKKSTFSLPPPRLWTVTSQVSIALVSLEAGCQFCGLCRIECLRLCCFVARRISRGSPHFSRGGFGANLGVSRSRP